MRDPYDVLGVARSASAAELKAVFRKLVRELHPDTIKHDPGAASRIVEINGARP
jgi:curved DNA-binding protein CbpA